MPASASRELVDLLRGIEQRSRARAAGLPQQEETRQYWEGVIFSLGDARLAAPLNEVTEILHFPSIVTAVPGTRPWVRGVANIRGNLLPIVDLQLFLGGGPVMDERRGRILVIRHGEIFTGLLVKEVTGMRHFQRENRIDYSPPEGPMEKFVHGAFEQDGGTWPVFSMYALAESPEFQVAAL
ncbi:MAG TPA: purine-binding chemotaxis protein CheW [Sedimenticola sp.]|nr:purine-binding chemotaxis protein CheW [Sedimenticola sp.]